MNSDATANNDDVRHRPTWMLLALALPIGIALNFLSAWPFNQLSDFILSLLAAQAELSRFQEGLVGMAVNLGIPTVLVYCLLKFTRLGVWLALNRLALGVTVFFDIVIIVMGAHRLYKLGLDQWPHLGGSARGILDVALPGCLFVGLVLLALSTLWHRTEPEWSAKRRVVNAGKWLWREV